MGFAGDPTGGELEAARAEAHQNSAAQPEQIDEPDAAAILGDVMRHIGAPIAHSTANTP